MTVTICYILGTVCVLLALPSTEVNGLQGLVQAVSEDRDSRGYPGVLPLAAFLIALSNIGAAGAYLAAVARLPFVAGIDRFCPSLWSAASELENTVGSVADSVRARRDVYFPGTGWHQRQGRVRRSG